MVRNSVVLALQCRATFEFSCRLMFQIKQETFGINVALLDNAVDVNCCCYK